MTHSHSQDTCPALTVQGLSAGYPGARNVLHDASFTVMQGERLGILGPNGAGKSTLFKAIAGLIPHHTGQISIHGENCRTSHRMVGYVPQIDDIDWHFPVTVGDVVMMGRVRQIGWFRYARQKDWQIVDALLDRVGMLAFRGRQIGELSGGQRRRVFIARALAQETDVLLLDEPFSGIDVAAEQEITRILDVLRDDGVTVILATHDLGAAQRIFDKLLLLKHTVIACGTPEEVFTADNLRQVYGQRVGIFHNHDDMIVVADTHR